MNVNNPETKSILLRACELANEFLGNLNTFPAGVTKSHEELIRLWEQQLHDEGIPAEQVIDELNTASLPGLQGNQGGRFFSWVIGGSHPAALAADWLTSAWDQNSGKAQNPTMIGFRQPVLPRRSQESG